MNTELIISTIATGGIAGLGAVFLLKSLVSTGIEEAVKLNFSRHIEDYKSQLTKSEAFFLRQLDALAKLRAISRGIIPKKKFPDMEWHDACEIIAESFEEHADNIDAYLSLHSAVLPKKVLQKLESAATNATEGTFLFEWNPDRASSEPSVDAIRAADALYDGVKDAVSILQESVDSQIEGKIE